MITLTARFDGKVFVPDSHVDIPMGVPLRLTVDVGATDVVVPAWQVAVDIGKSVPDAEWAQVPPDAAKNLDQYLHSAPRSET